MTKMLFFYRDKDHVRTRDIPPFMMLSIPAGDSGRCVLANPDGRHHITYEAAGQCGMSIIDEGYPVPDRDMNLILHHPWPKQLELERRHAKQRTIHGGGEGGGKRWAGRAVADPAIK